VISHSRSTDYTHAPAHSHLNALDLYDSGSSAKSERLHVRHSKIDFSLKVDAGKQGPSRTTQRLAEPKSDKLSRVASTKQEKRIKNRTTAPSAPWPLPLTQFSSQNGKRFRGNLAGSLRDIGDSFHCGPSSSIGHAIKRVKLRPARKISLARPPPFPVSSRREMLFVSRGRNWMASSVWP